jgi:hypothetical protein
MVAVVTAVTLGIGSIGRSHIDKGARLAGEGVLTSEVVARAMRGTLDRTVSIFLKPSVL